MDETLILALTTEADMQRAEALARVLLERRLAACVALTPVCSLYHWQGAVQQSSEVQLLIKTQGARLQALEQAVMQLHSYDTPQWLIWPAAASPGYGQWLTDSCAFTPAAAADDEQPALADQPADGAPTG